jgi:hypothetical protein
VKFCSCPKPVPQPVEGVMVCGECGDRVPDPLLVALDRKVDALGKADRTPVAEAVPTNGPALQIPPELIEVIAARAAELIADRMVSTNADGWLRGAEEIASYIGAPRSRVYALASCNPQRIPVHHDGSALTARRSELDAWLLAGGGVRP